MGRLARSDPNRRSTVHSVDVRNSGNGTWRWSCGCSKQGSANTRDAAFKAGAAHRMMEENLEAERAARRPRLTGVQYRAIHVSHSGSKDAWPVTSARKRRRRWGR